MNRAAARAVGRNTHVELAIDILAALYDSERSGNNNPQTTFFTVIMLGPSRRPKSVLSAPWTT